MGVICNSSEEKNAHIILGEYGRSTVGGLENYAQKQFQICIKKTHLTGERQLFFTTHLI